MTVEKGLHIGVKVGFPITMRFGKPRTVAASVTLRDIGERKRAEQELRDSEAKYRAIFDASWDALLVADAKTGMLLDANPAALALLGRSLEEIRSLHQTDIHAPEDGSASRASFEERRRESATKEHIVLRPGSTFWFTAVFDVPPDSPPPTSVNATRAVSAVPRQRAHRRKRSAIRSTMREFWWRTITQSTGA